MTSITHVSFLRFPFHQKEMIIYTINQIEILKLVNIKIRYWPTEVTNLLNRMENDLERIITVPFFFYTILLKDHTINTYKYLNELNKKTDERNTSKMYNILKNLGLPRTIISFLLEIC